MNLLAWLRSFRRRPAPVVVLWPPVAPVPEPVPPAPAAGAVTPYTILDAHNAERAIDSLPPLRLEDKLQAMADSHAQTMARNGIMDHETAGDGSFQLRIDASGYAYSSAAENIAEGQTSIPQVMGDWMASAGHRANVLGDFADVGLAVAHGVNGLPYWCSCFGRPL
jgi:uncharacterized protein YkwD